MRVTITGADNEVDPLELSRLSHEYPFVEWGILYSRKRMGTPRYPDLDWIDHLAKTVDPCTAALSLHLCGAAARDVLTGEAGWPNAPALARIQINGYRGRPHRLEQFHASDFVLQVRDADHLPDAAVDALSLPSASILWDPSGGRGEVQETWPLAPAGVRMGIAGGITPDTVVRMVHEARHAAASWIDMETGVRTDDRFDMDKVRAVLQAVAEM